MCTPMIGLKPCSRPRITLNPTAGKASKVNVNYFMAHYPDCSSDLFGGINFRGMFLPIAYR